MRYLKIFQLRNVFLNLIVLSGDCLQGRTYLKNGNMRRTLTGTDPRAKVDERLAVDRRLPMIASLKNFPGIPQPLEGGVAASWIPGIELASTRLGY